MIDYFLLALLITLAIRIALKIIQRFKIKRTRCKFCEEKITCKNKEDIKEKLKEHHKNYEKTLCFECQKNEKIP